MQQQTITITTQGTDLRITTPQHDYQPPHLPESGSHGGEERHTAPSRTTSARGREKGHGETQKLRKGQRKLRKMSHPQQTAAGPPGEEPPSSQVPKRRTESPDSPAAGQPGEEPQSPQVPKKRTEPPNSPAAGRPGEEPQSPQVPKRRTDPPNSPAPTQPPSPPPKQKPTRIGPRIFHYSRCTGKKKAVCIGINYTGSGKELKGCVNDAHNIRKFLMKNWKFNSRDIRVLTDDNRDPKLRPTKANMLDAMKWLVKDAKTHDSLFFHYSGHGGQLRSSNSDEASGYDDIIFPVDYEQKGVGIITDDTMNTLMVRTIPDGCRLTALFDSCHSGSALDLVYLYHSNGLLRSSPVSAKYRKMKSSPGDVICFSGCEDSQTSADTVEGGLAVGAMSYAFIKCLNANPRQSYQQLLKAVRALLRKRFSQRPQLSTSHKIDIRKRFIL